MDRIKTEEFLIAVLGIIGLAAVAAYEYYQYKKAKQAVPQPITTELPTQQQLLAQQAASNKLAQQQTQEQLAASATTAPPSPEEVQTLASQVAAENGLPAPVAVPSQQELANIGAQAASAGLDPTTAQNAAIVAAATGAKYIPFTNVSGQPITEAQFVATQQASLLAAHPTQTKTTSEGVTLYQIPGTSTYVTRAAYLAYLQRVYG